MSVIKLSTGCWFFVLSNLDLDITNSQRKLESWRKIEWHSQRSAGCWFPSCCSLYLIRKMSLRKTNRKTTSSESVKPLMILPDILNCKLIRCLSLFCWIIWNYLWNWLFFSCFYFCFLVFRDEDELLNTQCPQNLELRWQAEVSSSIYATPLIADINRLVITFFSWVARCKFVVISINYGNLRKG